MIIQLDSTNAESTQAARRSLETTVRSWGHEITEATPAAGNSHDAGRDKGIDPVSAIALVLSIPSAATAVLDLADRITKRRRAAELIDQAKQVAGQQVTVRVISRTRELRTLNPDQLLDLLADEDHPGTAPLPHPTRELRPGTIKELNPATGCQARTDSPDHRPQTCRPAGFSLPGNISTPP
jgi:hypothetical protein